MVLQIRNTGVYYMHFILNGHSKWGNNVGDFPSTTGDIYYPIWSFPSLPFAFQLDKVILVQHVSTISKYSVHWIDILFWALQQAKEIDNSIQCNNYSSTMFLFPFLEET